MNTKLKNFFGFAKIYLSTEQINFLFVTNLPDDFGIESQILNQVRVVPSLDVINNYVTDPINLKI